MIRNNKLFSDNRIVSSMSIHGGSTMTILLYGDRIPGKAFCLTLSEISITGNKITQGPNNQSKKAKVDSSIDRKISI